MSDAQARFRVPFHGYAKPNLMKEALVKAAPLTGPRNRL